MLQFKGIESITDIKDMIPEQVCEIAGDDKNKVFNLGVLPVPYRPIRNLEITPLEIGKVSVYF